MLKAVFHLAFIGPGGSEMLVVMLVLLMLFGSKDAPRIFRRLNEIMSQIRRATDNFRHEMLYSDLDRAHPIDPGEVDSGDEPTAVEADGPAELIELVEPVCEDEPGEAKGGDGDVERG